LADRINAIVSSVSFGWTDTGNSGKAGAFGLYPTSGCAELLIVLRYTDSQKTQFYSIPCPGGKPWFDFVSGGVFLGAGSDDGNHGVFFDDHGNFASRSLTEVFVYYKKTL
jgi:hypothetical protein